MAMETHPPIDGESKSPHGGGGFETSREARRRRRREHRGEHERAHVPLEPLTIWVRSDPNRLQHPEHSEAAKAEKSVEQPAPEHEKPAKKHEAKQHEEKSAKAEKHEHAHETKAAETTATQQVEVEREMPTPEVKRHVVEKLDMEQPMEDLPALQALPRLDIRPRHFYTEPEVRQPNATEIEHDILPAANVSGDQASEVQTQDMPSPAEKMPQTGQQMQEIAEQTARRAAELEEKNREEQVRQVMHETATAPETKEPMSAVVDGEFESNTTMGHEELLTIGESIHVEGVSITEMFNAGRLDEEGLRRIVVEFLRGQRIERIVMDEVLRQQMRFERDPQLRQVPIDALQEAATLRAGGSAYSQPRKFSAHKMRRQADRIADRLSEGIDRAVERAENNPNTAKTVGIVTAVIVYFIILIWIIRS
jgi:hypothetical protein